MEGTGMNETGDMGDMEQTGDMKQTGDMNKTGNTGDMGTGDMKSHACHRGGQRPARAGH
jgi:hypothetical protein